MKTILRLLDVNDRWMAVLTRDMRLGHVLWGVGVGFLAAGDGRWEHTVFMVMTLFAGFVGMVHGYIKDRQDGRP